MKRVGDIIWGSAILVISLLFLLPDTNAVYITLNSNHPFVLGFLKFAILAMMGELLVIRIIGKEWKKVKGFFTKMLVWGIIGIVITFMFKLFPMGIQGLIDHDILFVGQGFIGRLLFGLYTSIVANFAFGPIFMAAHRIVDTYIDMRIEDKDATVNRVLNKIDWVDFIRLIVFRMLPLFWLPAHTLTFLLPEDYRILFAAYLSIVLGAMLAIVKRNDSNISV